MHTQGKLKRFGKMIASETDMASLVAEAFTGDDARRIVACWNACEGISIEALERPGLSLWVNEP